MKSLSNPVNYGWLRSNDPDAAGSGGAVGLAALCAVREADATMSAEGWTYAPAVAPAGWLPHTPPVSAGAR